MVFYHLIERNDKHHSILENAYDLGCFETALSQRAPFEKGNLERPFGHCSPQRVSSLMRSSYSGNVLLQFVLGRLVRRLSVANLIIKEWIVGLCTMKRPCQRSLILPSGYTATALKDDFLKPI